ncbi:Aminopeptidase M1, partial [Pseudolycoriella hygida]
VGLSASGIAPLEITRTRDVKYSEVPYRLPNNTKPEAYDLFLATDIASGVFNFSAEIKIRINILEETNYITLHQHGLRISSAQLARITGENINIKQPQYDQLRDFVTFETDNTILQPGQSVTLVIKYDGTLNDKYFGFYQFSYHDVKQNRSIWIATTHFEPIFARRCFPCYDEPALKATFNIQIAHSSNYTAISNMPEAERTINGSQAITRFEQTPPISSYLIAFVIFDFNFKEMKNDNGYRYRIYASAAKIDRVEYALIESDKVHTALSNYLRMNFTLPKMDQVALPNYSPEYGATENWGLIIYKEHRLLYNEEKDADEQKTLITSTISHEISHQWFGNLVTPKWWNYVWLNEGLGTLLEYVATDMVLDVTKLLIML